MPRKQIELTEAEWVIIKAVWESEPCAAPDIQERLFPKTSWSYSTVRTMMDRMVTKGLLHAEKSRHITQYRSAVTRQQAQRSELLQALKRAFDGALSPMVQCLLDSDSLTHSEIEEIEALIRQKKRSGAGKK